MILRMLLGKTCKRDLAGANPTSPVGWGQRTVVVCQGRIHDYGEWVRASSTLSPLILCHFNHGP
ncbi:MAG: hypothetical protein RLZZ609_735 [Cyanobacteriota bacterium]|jgi:hypothetical protein